MAQTPPTIAGQLELSRITAARSTRFGASGRGDRGLEREVGRQITEDS